MFAIVCRNTERLSGLINKVLEVQTGKHTGGLSFSEIDNLTVQSSKPATINIGNNSKKEFTLLIVDDNADILTYLKTILSDNYQVFEAADGKEGLQVAEKEVPDLIISDIMMPVMNGLEFCRHIKDNIITNHIPVILLTARSLDEHQVEGFKSGADAYITKPFSSGLLLARIDNLLKKPQTSEKHLGESKPDFRTRSREKNRAINRTKRRTIRTDKKNNTAADKRDVKTAKRRCFHNQI